MKNRTPLSPPPEATLWDDPSLPMKLGCTACPELQLCGGLRIAAGVFDCRVLCACQRTGKRCSGVCRRDARVFIRRVRDVGGFEFDNVPRCEPAEAKAISDYVPIIYNGTNRIGLLDGGTVAVPLLSVFNQQSGTGRFETREEMLEYFRLSRRTRIILTGVAEDRAIERWWSLGDRPRLIETLKPLGVEMVTAPNYSLFTDVSRLDNLQNMKRIALTFAEFMAGGMPCALHVNGRTPRDYERWTGFVAERDEVSSIAFEFTTGTAGARGEWHRDQLVALARQVGRPLHLFVRGGRRHLQPLTAAFSSVTVLDAGPYLKTKHRQRARLSMGAELEWRLWRTSNGEALDDLLQHNIAMARHSAELRRGWLRADYGHAESRDLRPLLQPRATQ